ncbi:MAG: hypothetical protein JXA57_19455 [Armatimonadetes bacterium]|nr:hypothetical protein [Armatimonadota bacterium]
MNQHEQNYEDWDQDEDDQHDADQQAVHDAMVEMYEDYVASSGVPLCPHCGDALWEIQRASAGEFTRVTRYDLHHRRRFTTFARETPFESKWQCPKCKKIIPAKSMSPRLREAISECVRLSWGA